jgi:ribonuclease HI
VLFARDGTEVARRAELLGRAGAAEAEYRAILFGLDLAREHGAEPLEVRSDSQLAIAALRAQTPVADELAAVVAQVREAANGRDVRWTWHGRRQNELADALVRELLWP